MTDSPNTSGLPPHFPETENSDIFLWYLAFGVVGGIIILSNVVTMAAFRNHRLLRMRIYFVVNLSIADMTVGAVALPMYIYLLYNARNLMPATKQLDVFQHVHISIDVFTGMASVFTLTAIASERLVAISCPIYYRAFARSSYFVVLCGIWLLAGALSGARLLSYAGVLPMNLFTYGLVLLSLASLTFLLIAYTVLWMKLKVWSNTRRRIAGKKESNLFRAIAFVTLAFMVTWLPFHILNIIVNFNKSLLGGISYEVVYLVKLSHYSNSLMNPIIYSFNVPEFRNAVQRLFLRRNRLRCRGSDISGGTLQPHRTRRIMGNRGNEGVTVV